MALNQWFKFYGGEYLSDPKISSLTAAERCCWVTILCLSSISSEPGIVEYLTKEVLLQKSGIVWNPYDTTEWDNCLSILEKLERMKMIVCNEDGTIEVLKWKKRQDSTLTNAERQAKYRNSNEKVTEPVTKVTLDKIRIDKIRVEREEKPHTSLKWLTAIEPEELKELSEKYEASVKQIERKAETMKNYCLSKGKVYKDYRAFLENALDKDFGRRIAVKTAEKTERRPLTDEAKAKMKEISDSFKVASV